MLWRWKGKEREKDNGVLLKRMSVGDENWLQKVDKEVYLVSESTVVDLELDLHLDLADAIFHRWKCLIRENVILDDHLFNLVKEVHYLVHVLDTLVLVNKVVPVPIIVPCHLRRSSN